jgi:hypothetical protein
MFTIDRSDGNLFLARQPRQSPQSRRTGPIETFMQQFACKAAELEELAAAFTQHRKQYRAFFRAATASPPLRRNISPQA